MLALFPPNRAFFRFGLGQDIIDEVNDAALEGGHNNGDFDLALAGSERTVIRAFDSTSSLQVSFVAIQYLIVAGNVLMKVQEDNSMRLFRLDHYVMTRDSVGNVKKIITQENVSWENLPEDIQKKVPKPKRDTSNEATAASDGNRLLGEDLDLFTEIKFKSGNKVKPWSVRQ